MEAKQEENVSAEIKGMEIGEERNYPLQRYNYVQSLRTRIDNENGQKYKTRIDRKSGVVHIKRIS